MSIPLDIQEHEAWVERLARRLDLKGQGLKDDLYQEGMLGLMQAASRFNPKKNESFRRYAYARVRGSMVDWLRRFLPGQRSSGGPFKALFIDSLDREIRKTDRQSEPLTIAETIGRDGVEARRRLHMLCREILTAREYRIIQHVYFERGTARALCGELGISESQISHDHSRAKRKLFEAIGDRGEMGDFEGTVGGRNVTGAALSSGGSIGYQREYYYRVTKRKRAVRRARP